VQWAVERRAHAAHGAATTKNLKVRKNVIIKTKSDILRRCLAALLPHTASDDETRAYLDGVYFDGLQWVATDGHTMAKASPVLTKIDAPGSAILPAELCKRIVTLCKGKIVRGITITVVKNDVSITNGTDTISGKSVDSEYVRYDAVMPKAGRRSDDSALVGVNPCYLMRAGKACKDFTTDREFTRGVVWQMGTELDPVRLDFQCHDTGDLVIVIMPMRI